MFDEQDQEVGPVLVLVIGIAIVVSLFTIAVALSVTGVLSSGASRGPSAQTADASSPRASVYFATGSSELPADTAGTLFTIVVAATIEPSRHLAITGYTDASGDPARNVELAKERALAVRDALHAAGIARTRLDLDRPIETTGGEAREGRRVDVELR